MSNVSPLDLYQQVLNQYNQVKNTYTDLQDNQADRSGLENAFKTQGQDTQPTIPTTSQVLNTIVENDTNTRIVNQANVTQQLMDAFNSTAQASANKTKELVTTAKSTIVKATTVAKTPKTIPSDIYQLVYELTGMTVDTLEAWMENAEFNEINSHLPTIVSLLDKLINMLANYQNGGENDTTS
ncbi:MAG: hypothetical protein JHC38_08890 [Thiotrichales bacterium]|nr:hypothetical protein [Thiotrichales bacterium]